MVLLQYEISSTQNPVRDNFKLFDLYCTAYWSSRLDWHEIRSPNSPLHKLSLPMIESPPNVHRWTCWSASGSVKVYSSAELSSWIFMYIQFELNQFMQNSLYCFSVKMGVGKLFIICNYALNLFESTINMRCPKVFCFQCSQLVNLPRIPLLPREQL